MGCAKRAAGNPKRGIDPKNHLLVFRLVRLPTANPRPQIHHQRVEANKKIDPTNTNTTFNAPSRFIVPSSLLHSAYSPDVASLRTEAVEHHPPAVRRPDGIVDPHARIGKFVNLLGLAPADW